MLLVRLVIAVFALPAAALAQVTPANLPGETEWYLHADVPITTEEKRFNEADAGIVPAR